MEQGDCDSNDMCLEGLICGLNNCQTSLGYDPEVDCCYVHSLFVGDENFCTTVNPCGLDEGDCDLHEECQENMICGSANCPSFLGFDPDTNCCYNGSVGDENFCTTGNPCGQDQGDCDLHKECHDGLKCGSNNCPHSLGFDSEVDCCLQISGCGYPYYWGDSYCEDENNNAPCKWDGGDCCGNDTNTYYCSACECLDPNAISRKHTFDQLIDDYGSKKNPRKFNFPKHPSHSGKEDRMSRSRTQYFGRENRIPHFRNHPMHYHNMPSHPYEFDWEENVLLNPQFGKLSMKRSRIKSNKEQHKAKIRKMKSTNGNQVNLTSHCYGKYDTYENSGIVCNDLASSAYGLIVVLNPNEEEYSNNAVKNNFIGFKTLVHSPYDFPEVDAVGMAIDKNIQSNIGIRGYHSWITEAADSWRPDQKRCASRDDITLSVFNYYTRKNCMLECEAKVFQDMCGCLPYHYPDFYLAWEGVNSTACNYTGLLCLSKVLGRICFYVLFVFNIKRIYISF